MRQLQFTKQPHALTPEGAREQAEQVESLLLQWAALGSAGLSPEAAALQPLVAQNARFVVSLARQYQNQGVSTEALLTVAHEALIALLNRCAHRPVELDNMLAHTLRNAMIAAIQAQATESL